jgi:hypothetical protein
MNIIEPKERSDISEDVKLSRIYTQFQELIKELKGRELPDNIIETVNKEIEGLNSTSLIGKELKKLTKQKQTRVLGLLEKELKIVPKNHYRTIWLCLGMSVFGLPIGLIYGFLIGNIGLLGTGVGFGMCVGMVLGAGLDKKAFKEGRQLSVEIKY